jgi:hypothetical protein
MQPILWLHFFIQQMISSPIDQHYPTGNHLKLKTKTIGVRTTLNYLFPPSELTTWWHMFTSNEQDIAKWMNTAIPALEGEKPIELLLKEDGEKVVLDCL